MLELQITRWIEELDGAERYRDRHLTHWDGIIDRMTGPDYRGDGTSKDGDPENCVDLATARV